MGTPRAAAARALRFHMLIVTSRGANEECTSASIWMLRRSPEITKSSSTPRGIPWKWLSRYATESLSWNAASLGSARQELKAVHAVQGRMLTSWSTSTAQIHEQEGQTVEDSDGGSGSEMEECEWKDDDEGAEEPDDLENLEDLEADLEDTEEPTEPTVPREPRKSNGREPDYSMRIEAPVDEIYALLHSRGFINVKQKRPTPNDSVLAREDHRIVSWYRRVSVGLLNYYSCCDNFLKVKAIVNYQLRWSAIHTFQEAQVELASSHPKVWEEPGGNTGWEDGDIIS